jgi:hypothetical protein
MSEGANLDRGSPTGVHRYPPRIARQTRGGRSAMRGSPLWTPWTTRSASGGMGVNSSCRQGVNSGCRLTGNSQGCRQTLIKSDPDRASALWTASTEARTPRRHARSKIHIEPKHCSDPPLAVV